MHTTTVDRRRLLTLALGTTAGALCALTGQPASSQERTVRFILPNATGSGVDAITRAAQPALAKALGHPVIVDNQAGAGGVVGLQALARSPADGFTLSVVSNNVVIFPSVLKSVPFDMPGDFTPIAVVGYTPIVLVVHPKVAAANAREFAALLAALPLEDCPQPEGLEVEETGATFAENARLKASAVARARMTVGPRMGLLTTILTGLAG